MKINLKKLIKEAIQEALSDKEKEKAYQDAQSVVARLKSELTNAQGNEKGNKQHEINVLQNLIATAFGDRTEPPTDKITFPNQQNVTRKGLVG